MPVHSNVKLTFSFSSFLFQLQIASGDVVSTNGAFDVITETPQGTPWIPANYKAVEQYLPTPFGSKQSIEVMCAPAAQDQTGESSYDFYEYDSHEADTATADTWTNRGSPNGIIDCTTSFRGQCSQKFGSGAANRNFEHTTNVEHSQTHSFWVLSNKDNSNPIITKNLNYGDGSKIPSHKNGGTNNYAMWNYIKYQYICMAYKMPPGIVINMLVYINGYSWRSYTMTQTKNPTSYKKAGDWGQFIQDNQWHYTCMNVATEHAKYGITRTGSEAYISRVIWHAGTNGVSFI